MYCNEIYNWIMQFQVHTVHCLLCLRSLPVYDRYPLIDGEIKQPKLLILFSTNLAVWLAY